MSIRLVKAPISIAFSPLALDGELYAREFDKFGESDDSAMSHWLKFARIKGDTVNTDPILLNLVVELHRKIDALERFLRNEEPKRVSLVDESEIESIGFEHFKLSAELLEAGKEYYGRVAMPVHPKRDVALFFRALDGSLAQITKMHERDEKEWSIYLTARERMLIREARESRE